MTVIREVMTQQLVTVEPLTPVAAAVTAKGMHRVGAVLVMEHGRLEGIFTERDLVRATSYDIGGIQPAGFSLDDPRPRYGGPRSVG
jgi:CBS domain-containing protein